MHHFKSSTNLCLACDFGKSNILLLEAEKSPSGLKLLKFQRLARPEEKEKEAQLLKEALETGHYQSRKVRISVKGQGVIVRFVQFPQMKSVELRNAISFEIDQYIPFKEPEVLWDFQILEENLESADGAAMNVLLVAVKRDEIYGALKTFQEAGLEVELIDVDALAVMNAFAFFYPERFQMPIALLDIGTEVSSLSVAHHGKPRFIHDISFGGMDILKRLRRKLGLSPEQALEQMAVESVPMPEAAVILRESLVDLAADLKVSFNYYLDQVPSAEPVKQLFLGSVAGYYPIVRETLGESLGIEIEAIDVLSKIEIGPEIDGERIKKAQGLLAVSLGLLIREA